MSRMGSYSKWARWLAAQSLNFENYGSFLPEQEKLFLEFYKRLTAKTNKVWTFSAPTASGKTHVMLLVSSFLAHKHTVAVIVPNNYLKAETLLQKRLIKDKNVKKVNVLSLHEYIVSNSEYDYVLVDEAHNLRTSLELDTRVVKSFRVFEEEIVNTLSDRFLPPGTGYNAQKLSASDARFVLQNITNRFPSSRKILKTLTAWSGFIYISHMYCEVKFIKSEGIWSFRLPGNKLILFSATPLSISELTFYCGIGRNMVEETVTIPHLSRKPNQTTFLWVNSRLDDEQKMRFLRDLLSVYPRRVLVLFNSLSSCSNAHRYLLKYLGRTRVFHISSYEESKSRMKRYREYIRQEDGILVSSSSVFWEGISVKDLGLLVIADCPYPRPSLLELSSGQRTDTRLLISRRLKQGLGRIGRAEKAGVCVICFDMKYLPRSLKDLDLNTQRQIRSETPSQVLDIVKARCSCL